MSSPQPSPLVQVEISPAPTPGQHTILKARLASLLLVALTSIWGSTFVVMHGAIKNIPPSVVMISRFVIAALVLSPFIRFNRKLWIISLELGFWLWAGYMTQVVGLQYTTVNRSAFITSLTVIFVPMIAAMAGKKVSWLVWVSAGLAMIGVGFLSYDGSLPNIGDAWTLLCAVTYAIFIYRLEWAANNFGALQLTACSMVVVSVFSAGYIAYEHPHFTHMAWAPVIYLGLVATAITTTLQTVGQKWVPAERVGVIYTLEPVWASVFGYFVVGELLGPKGFLGAALIVVAAILCQIRVTEP